VFFAGGFLLEVVADEQKRRFRNNPAMAGRFITSAFLDRFLYSNNAHFTKTGSAQT
jgi:steroid 5-alpha reductase family enzyme